MKKIVLTGGGTAGHVTPNIALIPKLVREGYDIYYIGSEAGIEKRLIEELNIKYYGISTGKLRRYFDKKNVTDSLKVVKGISEAAGIIKKIKPNLVFSKGGFVSVPVVYGAKINGVPVIIHESDMTPGLANKLSLPFANKICVTFPETLQYIPRKKGILTGTPIRKELFSGDGKKGIQLLSFLRPRPIVLVMGGSQGSVTLNNALRTILPQLTKTYNIAHICGKGNLDESLTGIDGYKQFEYVSGELPHLLSAAEMIVSRAGSNSINELLALKKPSLLIPLSKKQSRGDQILNAASFERQGFCKTLPEEALTSKTLIDEIRFVYQNKERYIETMSKSKLKNGVDEVMNVIRSYV